VQHDALHQRTRKIQLTAAREVGLDKYENQIVSVIRWLVLAYSGPPETTNCRDATFHDRQLEIFENPSDHAPQIGDPTPIICEVTPRTEQRLYRDGIRIQSLAGFFRLLDRSFRPAQRKARKIRVTGYLLWDDDQRKRRCRFNNRVYRQQRISPPLALDGVGNSPDHED